MQAVLVHPKSTLPLPLPKACGTTIHVVEDRDEYAYKHYRMVEGGEGGKGVRIVVVRPDAYVGALVDGIEGLQKYFSRVLLGDRAR